MKHINLSRTFQVRVLARQNGASLLEGIAYLGIAALVILGAVSLLTGAFAGAQSNRGMEEISAIRTNVKKLYMGQANSYVAAGGAAGDLTVALNTAGAFPSTLSYNGTNMVNTWGGNVTVAGNTSTFTIEYAGVPQQACVNMLSGVTGWVSVGQKGGTANTDNPLSPSDAVAICSTATNTIDFISQ